MQNKKQTISIAVAIAILAIAVIGAFGLHISVQQAYGETATNAQLIQSHVLLAPSLNEITPSTTTIPPSPFTSHTITPNR